jgi:membrane-bound ClpP family serine protease
VSGNRHRRPQLIIAGVVLLLLGLLLGVGILYTIGIILIIVGAVLWVIGSTGRAVGGRRHYY